MPAVPAPAGDSAAGGAPAKEGLGCKSASCAFQAAAPKAAYSSDLAAPFAFEALISRLPAVICSG
jgi:hypothetical protein